MMAAKNNIINALFNQGFYMTSDATLQPGGFGVRQLFAYGKNVDSYCGGAHKAFDLAKWHGALIKSMVHGTVLQGTGWNTFGWTVVIGFIDHNGNKWQMIIGHLNTNPLNFLRVGQNVKPGDIIGYQGASNNLNVTMASHIHVQIQSYAYRGEWAFTCDGVNIYNIDITTTKPTSGAASKPSKPTASKPSSGVFNKRKGRKTRNKEYAKGVVRNADGLGAAQYRWSGGKFTNRFWPDIKEGETVFIYATTASGWGRIYSPTHKGWVYLDRVQITQVF